MDDNRIEIVAGLDIPKTKSTIKDELKDNVKPYLDQSKALNIICHIDDKSIASLQSELNKISSGLKLDIPALAVKVDTNTNAGSKVTAGIEKSVEQTTQKVLNLKKTLSDLDGNFTKPFKAVLDTNNIINAERTMAKIQDKLSSLGTVTVTGKNNKSDSLYKIQATISASSGEVRTLNFLLDETDKKFKLLDSSYSDKGVVKVQQDIVRLKKELASFEASHTSIKDGLTSPLTEARNAIINLESGIGSVESAEKALDNLKTSAANIATNLKSTGASFNVFDNAVNKAENFGNTLKSLEMDINNLGASEKKSNLVNWLSEATQGLEKLKALETESGKGQEWSAQYKAVSSIIQDINNNLKIAQKEDSAFNKEFNTALKEEEMLLQAEQKRVQAARELREEQAHEYWQGRFDEEIKGMTTKSQILKDMKKYYEDEAKAAEEAKRQEKEAFKQDNAIETTRNRIAKTTAALNDYANKNRKVATSTKLMSDGTTTFKDKLKELQDRLRDKSLADSPEAFKHLNEEIATFKKEADAAGLTVNSLFRNMKTQLGQVLMQWISIQGAVRTIKMMVEEVSSLDAAMINLRKVTDETDETYRKFIVSSQKQAAQLHATTTDVVEQSAEWAKLGFNIQEAQELSKVSMIYSKVGEVDNTTAVSDLVTVLKAFNQTADESIQTVDALNKLGNNFATDAKSLGEGISVSASALAMAGNDLNQALALITGGTEITQNARETGNAIKVISLRLRGMKGQLEELNEETEGIESISKIQTQILNLTNNKVNIFNDDGSFKSTYEILKEISEIYNDLSDTSKASLTEIMFGKVRANQGLAVIQAFQSGQIEKAYETAVNSAGSATEEFDKLSEGIAAHVQDFKQAFETLSNTIIDSDLIKFVVDSGTTILNILSTITDTLGTLPVLIAGVTTALNIKSGKGRPKPNMPIYAPLQFCA